MSILKISSKVRIHQIYISFFAYTLLVILWGAWVRISHSGDGCGQSWPLCGGSLIPQFEQKKTWIEYAHRLMSGSFGLIIFFSYLWIRKNFEKPSRIRKYAFFSFVFTITEALLGAKLVLFGLVGMNDSYYRAFIMAAHQANSLLLTGFIALSVRELIAAKENSSSSKLSLNQYKIKINTFIFISFFLIACTGAIAALAGNLFPSTDLVSSFMKDFSAESHWLLRARIVHPTLAIIFGSIIAWYFYRKETTMESTAQNDKLDNLSAQILILSKWRMSLIICIGIIFGILTLISLSPAWMKVLHLAMAHLIWASLLLKNQT